MRATDLKAIGSLQNPAAGQRGKTDFKKKHFADKWQVNRPPNVVDVYQRLLSGSLPSSWLLLTTPSKHAVSSSRQGWQLWMSSD